MTILNLGGIVVKRFLMAAISMALLVSVVFTMSACGAKEAIPETEGYELKIGYTLYAPMDYMENGQLVGFDADFGRKVCEDLGYTPKFIEIDWNTKSVSLKSGEIDLIWNGMTITDELKEEFLITDPYMENQQVIVVKKDIADKFKTVADLANASSIAYEDGSAADALISENDALKDVRQNAASAQKDAFLEVFAGTSEVAVVDITMAKSMTADGTDYGKTLTYVDVGFEKEEYGIALRKVDTVLCEKINGLIATYQENGFFQELYDKYMA